MKEQLIHYVDLLFAGAENAADIKQEILQNTLDRYDDLITQGKAPQAAYSLAISGIGDVSELLGSETTAPAGQFTAPKPGQKPGKPVWKKLLLAVAVCLYIVSMIPLFVLSEMGMEVLGLCGMFAIVGVATALIILSSGGGKQETATAEEPTGPKQELKKAVRSTITTVGLIAYFVLSFLTQAWYITWLIFPIMAAMQGLVNACIDLKEAK